MKFWYTVLSTYDKNTDKGGMSWDNYVAWSKLTHLKELVSLDRILNENLVEVEYDKKDDLNNIVSDGQIQTGFFTTPEYVLKKSKQKKHFNLLSVVVKPHQECKNIAVEGFEFAGYDLLDRDYSNSALTNCGAFDEIILPSDLNELGLISCHEKATKINKQLLESNPGEHYADTNIIAVWRHKTIGR